AHRPIVALLGLLLLAGPPVGRGQEEQVIGRGPRAVGPGGCLQSFGSLLPLAEAVVDHAEGVEAERLLRSKFDRPACQRQGLRDIAELLQPHGMNPGELHAYFRLVGIRLQRLLSDPDHHFEWILEPAPRYAERGKELVLW